MLGRFFLKRDATIRGSDENKPGPAGRVNASLSGKERGNVAQRAGNVRRFPRSSNVFPPYRLYLLISRPPSRSRPMSKTLVSLQNGKFLAP